MPAKTVKEAHSVCYHAKRPLRWLHGKSYVKHIYNIMKPASFSL